MSVLPAPRDRAEDRQACGARRGEIRWADRNPTRGREQAAWRPVLVLRHGPWVKISQIRTLSVERIGARLGRATPEEFTHVVEGLNEIIGL